MKTKKKSSSGRSKNSSASSSSGGGGRSGSRGPNRSDERASDFSESSASSRGAKSRRSIKNARSLADVVGGSRPGSGRPDGQRAPSARPSGQRFGSGIGSRPNVQQSSRPEPARSNSSSTPLPNSGVSKLTTIMTFQPREPLPAYQRPAQQPAQKPAVQSSSKPAEQASVRPFSQAPQGQSQQPSRPALGESSWPEQRRGQLSPASARDGKSNAPSSQTKNGRQIVIGTIKRHPDGFGFLIPDDRELPDVYVARQSMTGVMTNDRVEVEVFRPRGGARSAGDRRSGSRADGLGGASARSSSDSRVSGDILRVVSRANQRIVGRYLPVDQKYGVILDDNRGWGADLRISAADSLNAKEGDLVAVEIIQYPDQNREFKGRVVGLIGDADDPKTDVIRVIHEAGIPTEFSKEAIEIAKSFGGKVSDSERAGREDLTSLPLITIDGATARDFDDAIYVEPSAEGFRLVVAIADVSHYVKPGTVLDNDAYERGTSTYFPNFVVPMLPEALSNELCSLNPNVIRLCFCCEMKINFNGEIEHYRFFEGVMKSQARVIYGEAQEVLDAASAHSPRGIPPKLAHVKNVIIAASDLANILMKKRFREGSLDLEIPETQVVVDSSGESTDVIRSERLFAHRLIEELMLVTNICTARFLDEAQMPGIYRIHEEPDAENIRSLQRYMWNLGYQKPLSGSGLATKLTRALESMSDRPESQILNILALRTMKQAKYSEHNIGHFGLGFAHYSHFTSPIRRYPDLIAHRLIKSQLNQRYANMAMSEDDLVSAASWLSACEQRSVKAERKVVSIKKARFIRRFVGEEFEGIISSVTKFGVFVLLRQYDVDGLVKIENLGPDRFEFDDENLRLNGARSGLHYAIGDAIKIKVMAVDVETGKVDFHLCDEVLADFEKSGLNKNRGARGERGGSRSSSRGDARSSARGEKQQPKERSSGATKGGQQTQGRKKERVGASKRSETEDDRSSVRKKRVSKRRRKN